MPRLRAALVAALAVLACLVAAPAGAGAATPLAIDEGSRVVVLDAITGLPVSPRFRVFGYRWPRGTIRYIDLSPKRFRAGVKAAVRAWNASGTGVRFVATSRRSAALVIRTTRRHPVVQPSCAGVVGLATTTVLGSTPFKSEVALSPGCPPEVFRAVAAHELGHVLGLDHEDRRCALMNAVLGSGCRQPTQPWRYRCRLLEPDDIRGAASLYRGRRPRRPSAQFCDRWSAPPKVTRFTVAADPAGSAATAVVSYRAAGRAAHVAAVSVLRRAGACPTSPTDPRAEHVFVLPSGAVLGEQPAPGSWCYAAFTTDEYGRTRGAVTRTVTHATTAATRLGLRLDEALVGDAVVRTLRFTSPARPAFARATTRISRGTCAAPEFGSGPSIDPLPAPGTAVAAVVEGARDTGPTCISVTLASADGDFVTMERDVVLANHLPVGSATATPRACPDGLVVDLAWSATDPDGFLVDTVIDWGDGQTEPAFASPSTHAYAAPGTYAIAVTATDQAGGATVLPASATVATCPV